MSGAPVEILAVAMNLLPEGLLRSQAVVILSTFVAINTVMYAALAVARILPKIYFSDLVTRRNRRSESRSIFPDEQL